ncbi:MAG: hypothetical protein NVSMB32_14790 [Actinomycetota bacterium]
MRNVLVGGGLLVLVLLVAAGGLLFYVKWRLGQHGFQCPTCTSATTNQPAGAPFNVLVLGSDSREGLSAADLQYFDPTGQDRNSGQRSDSIVVVHVDPKRAKAVAIALPRDLMVTDAKGHNVKINSFYNQGPSAVVQEVQSFTGLPISHYIEINFSSFRTITNALGGVQVRFTRNVVDPNSGLNQTAGCNNLTGNQALAFVRVREIDSDFGRIQRQQLFVRLMMAKILTPGTLLNPTKVLNLINLGLGNLKHDSGLGLGTLEQLAVNFHSLSPNDIDFRVVPSAPKTVGGTAFVVANEAQAAALFTAIRSNSPNLPPYGKQGGVSAVDSSTVAATVLNGSKTVGVAAKAQALLEAQGFKVLRTGTADNLNYPATVVYYTPGNQAGAQFLAAAAFPGAPVEALPATIPITDGEAVVVLGKNYSQAAAKASPVAGARATPLAGAKPKSPSPAASPAASPSPAALPAGPPVAVQAGVNWFSAC